MRIKKTSTSLVLGALLAGLCDSAAANAWSSVFRPAPGPARAIGRYESGCLAGGIALPPNGLGYKVTRLERGRYYGHPLLVRYLQTLSQQSVSARLGTLLIGDLAQPRGGPMPYGHHSHQIGLDVDIWFRRLEDSNTGMGGSYVQPVSMLTRDGYALAAEHWSQAQAQVLQIAAAFPEVERIFVNPVIKQALCRQAGNAPWLRKLRPWYGHDDHFHVRLACPPGSPECVPQGPLPPGSGCGADLDWWFSAEARRKGGSGRGAPSPPPPACDSLLVGE
jgi:penicillin-insensitive murein endopeptidase